MLVKDYGGEIDWNIGAFCGHDEMMFDIDKACKMACEKNGIRYVFGSISTILQGGRIPPQKNLPMSEVLSRVDKYNLSHKISKIKSRILLQKMTMLLFYIFIK